MSSSISSHQVTVLSDGWQACALASDTVVEPSGLAAVSGWIAAPVPGTAAGALRQAGRWGFDDTHDFDAQDWWYRLSFSATPARHGARRALRLHGLATLAEVWLNGRQLLSSDNMFLAHELPVEDVLAADNELCIRFRAINPQLALKRPRPRWKTALVRQQQMRWLRTTLLGRMPGWSPPVAAVGPWRPVELVELSAMELIDSRVQARVEGGEGVVEISLEVRLLDDAPVAAASLRVGESLATLQVTPVADGVVRVSGQARVRDVALWWPHTHGEQPLYPVAVEVDLGQGQSPVTLDLGRTGFRTLELVTQNGTFGFRINGVDVFSRGACWTTTDVVHLTGTDADYESSLQTARAAGMNMLRISGTLFYEADRFHDRCDELGLLIWQDFMFANMDYPVEDPAFRASIRAEAAQLLRRLGSRPSLALLCGNSEVEQQAAMLGLESAFWSNAWFRDELPRLVSQRAPGVPYWPSTPSGGTLPFHVHSAAAHYYGVGAYLRPLEDARRSEVRFASECLAFANVPEPAAVGDLLSGGESPVHHPRWKRRVPRDNGAGWDFEDVRDHYLKRLFGLDPTALRATDMDRYLYLSRVVSGEVMAATIGEWRRQRSTCRGALVWFLRDLWSGAGWGVLDAGGEPKAAYWYLRRAMAPQALLISDEGLNGLALHAVNDRPQPLQAEIGITLLREAQVVTGEAKLTITVPAHSTMEISGDALLGRFADLSYAYRFGPPSHDVVVATLTGADGAVIAQAHHLPVTRLLPVADLGMHACLQPLAPGQWTLQLRTQRFAQAVSIDAPDWTVDDNYFALAPGAGRQLRMTARGEEAGPPDLRIRALNGPGPASIGRTADLRLAASAI